jgi:hypothetical protein
MASSTAAGCRAVVCRLSYPLPTRSIAITTPWHDLRADKAILAAPVAEQLVQVPSQHGLTAMPTQCGVPVSSRAESSSIKISNTVVQSDPCVMSCD